MKKEKSIFQKLIIKKTAVFALFIISLAFVLAIFAYVFASDKSPNANEQIPELALVSPGENFQLLLQRKNKNITRGNFFQRFMYGAESEFKSIPINQYEIKKDSIIIEKYEGLSEFGNLIEGSTQAYHLADIVYPVQSTQLNQGLLSIETIDGQSKQIELNELKELVIGNHIQHKSFLFGSDKFGRSIWSRLLLGIRISLLVGLIAVFISLTIGISLGALGGYFGNWIDNIIMLIINTVWSIPTLLLVFAIVLALGRGIGVIFFAVGLTMWVEVARIVRGQVKYFKESQFIDAARSMGYSTFRIIQKHILPNIIGPVMVIAAANFATAILIEAGLSYLGFGIRPPAPSIGNMLNENYGFALNGKPMLAIIPALSIMLLVLAFNLLGNALRDVLDVKTEQ